MSRVISINNNKSFLNALSDSIEVLKSGGLLIYPTDTIYGIGCDIYDENPLRKIAEIKGREKLQPYIILVSSFEMLEEFAAVNGYSKQMLRKYWPGPLTAILNSKIKLSEFIDNNNGKIAVRMPDNQFCLELISKYKKPITSTSANFHSKPQGDFNQIVSEFENKVDMFVYSGEVESFLPSTIVDLSGEEIKIVREGALKIIS